MLICTRFLGKYRGATPHDPNPLRFFLRSSPPLFASFTRYLESAHALLPLSRSRPTTFLAPPSLLCAYRRPFSFMTHLAPHVFSPAPSFCVPPLAPAEKSERATHFVIFSRRLRGLGRAFWGFSLSSFLCFFFFSLFLACFFGLCLVRLCLSCCDLLALPRCHPTRRPRGPFHAFVFRSAIRLLPPFLVVPCFRHRFFFFFFSLFSFRAVGSRAACHAALASRRHRGEMRRRRRNRRNVACREAQGQRKGRRLENDSVKGAFNAKRNTKRSRQ